MSPIPFHDFAREYSVLREDLLRAVERVMSSGHYILGPEVLAFEERFAQAVGAKYAIGVASGLDALSLGLRALGIGAGDEVITTPMSAAATALAVTHVGAIPVFVDVNREDLTLDPAQVIAAISARTKAVLPVHLYGNPARASELAAICRSRGILLVEDCAQSHLARVGGKPVGSFGTFAAYSFYPTKNLGAVGDAGAVTTDNAEFAATCRSLRDYGQRAKYEHHCIGYNSRLDELQAAILSVKLERLHAWTQRRKDIGARYLTRLSDLPLRHLNWHDGAVFHLFPIQVLDRDRVAGQLKKKGVATAVHYPRIIPDQVCYQRSDSCRVLGELENARDAARDTLSLPLNPLLTHEEQDRIIGALHSVLGSKAGSP